MWRYPAHEEGLLAFPCMRLKVYSSKPKEALLRLCNAMRYLLRGMCVRPSEVSFVEVLFPLAIYLSHDSEGAVTDDSPLQLHIDRVYNG